MNLTLSILTFLSILCIVSSQRPYADADCSGAFIFSFSDDLRRNVMDTIQNPEDETPNFIETNFTITNPPAGATDDKPGFEGVALVPGTTDTIYAIIELNRRRFLATVDMNHPFTVTIVDEILPATDTLVGMTIDCGGNIFAVEKELREIWQINATTGERTSVRQGLRNCASPGNADCMESIGYHMEDNLLYRISTPSGGGTGAQYRIYRLNADGTETESDILDPNGYCFNLGSIKGMQYIGNDLWLISCNANFGGVRILDTSNFSRPIIGPIGNYSGIEYDPNGSVDRSGSGFIATDSSHAFCSPDCLTTATPTTAAPTTAAPTTAAPTTAAPTTAAPTTAEPTTATPTTAAPTTTAPTTASPTTTSPTTASPTTAPPTTSSPTATTTTSDDCPPCPFDLSLVKATRVVITDECPTTTTTTTTTVKPSTSKKTIKTTKKVWSLPQYNADSSSSSSDSSDSRRRMVGIYKDSSDSIDMCFPNGDPLIFVDGLCENGWDKSFTADSSSRDGDATTDAFLAPVCVKYNVLDIANNTVCGEIEDIFLGLCTNEDTDFDVTLLGTGDIDNILSDDGNVNVLSAIGYRNTDGELGVQVILQNTDVLSFKLCFEDVAVTTQFNKERFDLDVTKNGAITTIDASGDIVSCTSLGLPCLNFFFGCDEDLVGPENGAIAAMYSAGLKLNAKHNCDCDRGMTAITLKYIGSTTAASIVVYNPRWSNIICTFNNVKKGDYITCTAKNLKYGKFRRQTMFSVLYKERRRNLLDIYDIQNGDCVGIVKTSCTVQIVGDLVQNCDDLIVKSHLDGDGALCNSQILALETDNAANAFINDNEQLFSDPLKVLDELDPYIRWALICIMITFVVLILISIYICFIVNKNKNKKKNKEESPSVDDILKTIAESQQKQQKMTKQISDSKDEIKSTTATVHSNELNEKQKSYDLNVEHEYYEEEEHAQNTLAVNIEHDDNVSGQFSSYR